VSRSRALQHPLDLGSRNWSFTLQKATVGKVAKQAAKRLGGLPDRQILEDLASWRPDHQPAPRQVRKRPPLPPEADRQVMAACLAVCCHMCRLCRRVCPSQRSWREPREPSLSSAAGPLRAREPAPTSRVLLGAPAKAAQRVDGAAIERFCVMVPPCFLGDGGPCGRKPQRSCLA
jgi:hypothetical protein